MEESKSENDPCVWCDKETPYPRTMPIEARQHYIEGLGQLCAECDKEIGKFVVA